MVLHVKITLSFSLRIWFSNLPIETSVNGKIRNVPFFEVDDYAKIIYLVIEKKRGEGAYCFTILIAMSII